MNNAPKMKEVNAVQHRSCDLCCGGGGASLGAHLAGFKSVLAVDMNLDASKCYEANFPDAIVLSRKMESVSVEEILKRTGLRVGELTHLHCSWPCVEYSVINTRVSKNPPADINRNFKHFLQKIQELQPMVFTGENVDGMLVGAKKPHFNQVISLLKGLENYDFKFKVMNAAFYEVPQNRRRLILIGKRKDVSPGVEIQFPKPNYKGAEKLRVKDVLPKVKLFRSGQFANKILPADQLMCTITGGNNIKVFDTKWRRLSLAETKLLMGFSKDFKMPATAITTNMKILGNAVCPPMMKAVMETIKQTILSGKTTF